jgi:hypothetical protein
MLKGGKGACKRVKYEEGGGLEITRAVGGDAAVQVIAVAGAAVTMRIIVIIVT